MKPLAIAFSGMRWGLWRGTEGNPTNERCKAIGNWLNGSLLYNEYTLIKIIKN
jgi:hypothetical protein